VGERKKDALRVNFDRSFQILIFAIIVAEIFLK